MIRSFARRAALWAALAATLGVVSAPPASAQVQPVANLVTCNQTALYDGSSSGETRLVAAVAGKSIYICGYVVLTPGTVNVNLDDYNGSTHTHITPAFQLSSTQPGAVDASPFWRGMSVAAGDALYINLSGSVAVQAVVYFIQF